MGIYNKGKEALAQEKKSSEASVKAVAEAKPEEILTVAQKANQAAQETTRQIENTRVALEKAAASMESLPQIGNILSLLSKLTFSVTELNSSVQELITETRQKNMAETEAAKQLREALDDTLYYGE
jgi:hypothetical protein